MNTFKNHNFATCLCAILLCGNMAAQQSDSLRLLSLLKTVVIRLDTLLIQHPQEKVYIHFDKPYYAAGDDIWFRAYLVNAASHTSSKLSRRVYVDLINEYDSIICKLALIPDSTGIFRGDIHLPFSIHEGYYRIRAFTCWMRNIGESFFFQKNIYIGNSSIMPFVSDISCSVDEDLNGIATVRFLDFKQQPLSSQTVRYALSSNKIYKNTLTTGTNGEVSVGFDARSTKGAKLNVEIDFNGQTWSQEFDLPTLSDSFDVQFLPEGGNLPEGQMCNMAFKAIGSNGLGVNVTGRLYDDRDSLILNFDSYHLGMGRFVFVPKSGRSYYAIVENNLSTKRILLPAASADAITLNAGQSHSNIIYSIKSTEQIAQKNKQVMVIAHLRGMMFYAQPVKISQTEQVFIIPCQNLPSGIVHLVLLDENARPISQRLIFIRNKDGLKIDITPDKVNYGKRDKVELNVRVTDHMGKPVQTTLSLAITDNNMVKHDSTAGDIFSNLLLTSDLRGYVEQPGYYFNDTTNVTGSMLDLLMMTQGWSRFDIDSVIRGDYPPAVHPVERGSFISGTVTNMFNKPQKNAPVSLLTFKGNTGINQLVTTTNEKGHFYFEGFEYPDGTEYIILATTVKGAEHVFITTDTDTEPRILPIIKDYERQQEVTLPYLLQSHEQNISGIIALGEVVVTAKRKTNDVDLQLESIRREFSNNSANYITNEEIEEFAGSSIKDIVLFTIAGATEQSGAISMRGSRLGVCVDGIARDWSYLDVMSYTEVEEMYVITNPVLSSAYGFGGSNFLYVKLKRGVKNVAKTNTNLVKYNPLGYYEPRHFYMPKYEVPEERTNLKTDLRTTIYWDPAVSTDSTGIARVSLYTADKEATYSVIMEGVSPKGAIGRGKTIINRMDMKK